MDELSTTVQAGETVYAADQPIQILRLAEVVRKTGLSKSTVHQRIRSGDFPQPVSLGARAKGYVAHEVDGYLRKLLRSRNKTAALVKTTD